MAVLGAAAAAGGEDVPVRARGGGDVRGRQRRLQPGRERQPRRAGHRVGRGGRRARAPAGAALARRPAAARLRARHRRPHRESLHHLSLIASIQTQA